MPPFTAMIVRGPMPGGGNGMFTAYVGIGSQTHLLGLEYEQVSRSERRPFQTVLIHGAVSISSGGLTSERRSASSL
jgi:hypothetical protein